MQLLWLRIKGKVCGW